MAEKVTTVVEEPDTPHAPLETVHPLDVTAPVILVHAPVPPEGAAQVPSPLQNVEDDALVPELRFVTGRFPVTSALAKFTAEDVTACVLPAK